MFLCFFVKTNFSNSMKMCKNVHNIYVNNNVTVIKAFRIKILSCYQVIKLSSSFAVLNLNSEPGTLYSVHIRTPEYTRQTCLIVKGFAFDSVAGPDPGSGAFLTPGSGIRNRFFPDLGSRILDPKPIYFRAY